MNIVEFLRARLDEDEAVARSAIDPDRPGVNWEWTHPDGDPEQPKWLRTVEEFPTTSGVGDLPAFPIGHEVRVDEERKALPHIARHDPARVLREVEAKRRIVDLHANWPVLLETRPTLEPANGDDLTSFTYRVSQQIAWTTEQHYRERFGTEPPTAPMIAALAAVYSDHPDYREEWA